jgi:hypothetical protein
LQELRQFTTIRILIFFDKIFLANLINHNLYGVEISAFYYFIIIFGIFSK